MPSQAEQIIRPTDRIDWRYWQQCVANLQSTPLVQLDVGAQPVDRLASRSQRRAPSGSMIEFREWAEAVPATRLLHTKVREPQPEVRDVQTNGQIL
eukprot:3695540-Pyramimonas_sp.AAC.1